MFNTSQIALAWELFEHGIPKSRIAAGERVSFGEISVTIEINKRVIIETLLYKSFANSDPTGTVFWE